MVRLSLLTILLSQKITVVKLSVTCYSFFFLLAVHVVAYGFNYYFLASGPASHACFFDTTVYSSDAFIRVGATLYGTLPGMITHNLISERQTFSSWTITFHILCVQFLGFRYRTIITIEVNRATWPYYPVKDEKTIHLIVHYFHCCCKYLFIFVPLATVDFYVRKHHRVFKIKQNKTKHNLHECHPAVSKYQSHAIIISQSNMIYHEPRTWQNERS